MSFVSPVSTFEEDVKNCLASVAALAFVGVGLVGGMEVLLSTPSHVRQLTIDEIYVVTVALRENSRTAAGQQ